MCSRERGARGCTSPPEMPTTPLPRLAASVRCYVKGSDKTDRGPLGLGEHRPRERWLRSRGGPPRVVTPHREPIRPATPRARCSSPSPPAPSWRPLSRRAGRTALTIGLHERDRDLVDWDAGRSVSGRESATPPAAHEARRRPGTRPPSTSSIPDKSRPGRRPSGQARDRKSPRRGRRSSESGRRLLRRRSRRGGPPGQRRCPCRASPGRGSGRPAFRRSSDRNRATRARSRSPRRPGWHRIPREAGSRAEQGVQRMGKPAGAIHAAIADANPAEGHPPRPGPLISCTCRGNR